MSGLGLWEEQVYSVKPRCNKFSFHTENQVISLPVNTLLMPPLSFCLSRYFGRKEFRVSVFDLVCYCGDAVKKNHLGSVYSTNFQSSAKESKIQREKDQFKA